MACFNLYTEDLLKLTFSNDPNFWIGTDQDFFDSPDIVKSHINRQNAVCIVHCVFTGTRLPKDRDFLYWIREFYQTTDKNTILIFIHPDSWPELMGVEKIKFIHFPEYHSCYYKVFKGYEPSSDHKLQKKFLSFNKRATIHRQLLYRAFLNHAGLMEQSWFSYLGQQTYLGALEDLDMNAYIDRSLKEWLELPEHAGCWPAALTWSAPDILWKYISDSDETYIKRDWQQWNDEEGFGSDREEPSWFSDLHYYQQSFCSVVVESDPISWKFNISEKSIRELAYGHPFILIGCRHSVKLLRELGFDMFDDVIDHSYDEIENDVSRFKNVWESILKINQKSMSELQQISIDLLPRRRKNIEHLKNLYDKKFRREVEILQELETLLDVRLTHLYKPNDFY